MHILPIASGKGGVGKSLISANLSIALAEAGHRVILADLDLGGSNLHLIMGINAHDKGIGSYLSNKEQDFQEIIMDSGFKNLQFIPGDAEIPGIANLSSAQKRALINRLLKLDADYLILDLGAGTSFNILDFFLMSGHGIVVSTPTPTSSVNAYLFLKNAIFRIIHSSIKRGTPGHEYIEKLRRDGNSFQRVYIPKLLEEIREVDKDSFEKFRQKMNRFHPRLIFNMLEDPKDAVKATKLRRSCQQYLDIDMEHLGIIYRDDLQDIALGSKLPILSYKPDSVLSQAIYRIADKLSTIDEDDDGPVDPDALNESFQTAELEAQIDFESKMDYIEDLLHSGTLTPGDLVETIKSQQFDLNKLKKENQFLKAKLVKAIQEGFIQ